MAREPKPTASPNKKSRYITLVYFVDAARTRSIRIPLRFFRFLCFSLSVLFLWGFGSGYAVYLVLSENQHMSELYKSSMRTLFEFQTRYDQVFEKVYQDQLVHSATTLNSQPISAEAAALASADGASKKTAGGQRDFLPGTTAFKHPSTDTSIDGSKNSLSGSHVPATSLGQDQSVKRVKLALHKPVQPEQTQGQVQGQVAIKLFKSKPIQDGYNFQFQVHNQNSPKTAEGYIWLIALYEDTKTGETLRKTLPKTIALTDKDLPSTPRLGERFSIRRFRNIELNLKNQANPSHKLRDIKLSIYDQTQNLQSEYSLVSTGNPESPYQLQVNAD